LKDTFNSNLCRRGYEGSLSSVDLCSVILYAIIVQEVVHLFIRDLQKEDLPQLAGLYAQFWNEQSDVSKMSVAFDNIVAANTHILLCAEENGRLLGSVMGVICAELYGDCRPFLVIENMIIDKTERRKGIGRLLLETLETRAKVRNCTQMILVTEKNRTDACAFYESFGFQRDTTGYKKKV